MAKFEKTVTKEAREKKLLSRKSFGVDKPGSGVGEKKIETKRTGRVRSALEKMKRKIRVKYRTLIRSATTGLKEASSKAKRQVSKSQIRRLRAAVYKKEKLQQRIRAAEPSSLKPTLPKAATHEKNQKPASSGSEVNTGDLVEKFIGS